MDKFSKFSYFLVICLSASSSYGQINCSDYRFSNNNNNNGYTACNNLPVLDSFLHWDYHPSNHTVDIAYRHTGVTASNWIVWSLNLGEGQMVGAQCLVALHNSSSGGQVHAYTSPISNHDTMLQEGPLSFEVPRIAAEFINNNEMIIYATIQLPSGRTSFTHVWQYGDVSRTTGAPLRHHITGQNMRSFGVIDFASARTQDTGAASGGSRDRNRNVHGVLNVVSWGILMPVGAMTARYLKVFKAANPAWFYIHVTCQASAYMVGVAGWGTGLKLGSDSAGVQRDTHRNIGITLFALGTLQVFALLLRPKPEHKYRFYWNIYHHLTGYSVVILSIINIFQGFQILELTQEKWRRAYIGVLIFLGAIVAVMETYTWYIVLLNTNTQSKSNNDNINNNNKYTNGTNEGEEVTINGYGA